MIRLLNVYYPTRTVMLLLCEAIIVASCFLAAAFLSLGSDEAQIALTYEYGYLKIAALTFISLNFSYYFDLFEPQLVSAREAIYFRILLVLAFDCFVVSAVLFFVPESSIGAGGNSHVYALGLALLTPVLILWRRAYDWIVGRRLFRERVYVLGAGEFARSLVQTIAQRKDLGMEVADWREIDAAEPEERRKIWSEDLQRIASSPKPVNRIIVAIEQQRGELPMEELLNLRFKGIIVEDVATIRERLSGKIQLDGLRPSSFLYAEGFRLRASQQFTRQILSTLAAAFGLLVFAPFFPLVVLAVRLSSPGPIFFKQTRVGAGGKNFQVVKFRTMRTDAERDGARWATKNDPRVTRVGMFLRKTRIDEIPQLWNVLRGDMGFVGPRPERPEFIPMLQEALPYFDMRHLIRPGLTGWAQVRYGYGASLAEAREKLEYDLYYIKHMSLGLDLLIMFETIKTILRRRGAQ
jgi:sugar transferase (PEP-CTERM system associated)